MFGEREMNPTYMNDPFMRLFYQLLAVGAADGQLGGGGGFGAGYSAGRGRTKSGGGGHSNGISWASSAPGFASMENTPYGPG